MSKKADKVKFERVRHEWVSATNLRVHPEVQRDVSERRVDYLAANLDPDEFGELSVVRVPKASYFYIFDGQHRYLAAIKVWGEFQRLPCAIYEDCPLERQAKIFLGQNDRLPLKALDKWLQRILAKEEKVLQIEEILHTHKLRTDKSRANGTVQAVAALERVFDRNGGASGLDRTLTILGEAWGRNPDAYDSHFIKGIGFLVNRFNGDMDDHDLIRKLARGSMPDQLIGQARNYSVAVGVSVERAMSEKLLQIYNKGRTTHRLELNS